jgi:EAL domain-containing protein (putative c-di-GMP-specific phosphodiesterase class I)
MRVIPLQYQPMMIADEGTTTVVACEQLSGAPALIGRHHDLVAMQLGCLRAAEWQGRFPGIGLSLNLPPSYLYEPSLAPVVVASLRVAELDPSLLTLELLEDEELLLTETVIDNLLDLQQHGVQLALDDVGSGAFEDPDAVRCLIGRLQRYGIGLNKVKLDRTLAGQLTTRARPFIDLAGPATVVAEGVETPALRDLAFELGLAVQGWAVSRKLHPDQLESFFAANHLGWYPSLSA